MARSLVAKFRVLTLVSGVAVVASQQFAMAAEEQTTVKVVEVPAAAGDENSDAINTSSIIKVDSGSCEKGTANLKVPGQPKTHVPEETP